MTDPLFWQTFRAACTWDVAEFRRQHDAWREEWQRQQRLKELQAKHGGTLGPVEPNEVQKARIA